ncbi:MAG: GrpB family protein [Phycisphaerales bacterium]|nr:GrpB family protein [Hyphomonadaceae bacterium]
MKVIRPHDPRWKELFTVEAQSLRAQLGQTALQIEHIGSTAIPNILAKPIIDIVVEAASLEDLEAQTPAMVKIGYESRGEHGIPGRRYFKKRRDGSGVGYHVHSFARGSTHIVRHVQFRDFLLLEPDVAQEYSALKQTLASSTGVLVDDYVQRKSEFVGRVQRLASLRFSEAAE